MAKTEDQVMELVRTELDRNPDIKSGDLQDIVKKAYPSVGKLSVRQFHARYPLQIKRDRAFAADGGASKPAKKSRKRAAKKGGARKGRRSTAPRTTRSAAPAAAPAANGGPDRDAVRAVFMRFAADLSAAEARKDLVKIVANVDRYVDDAIAAAR